MKNYQHALESNKALLVECWSRMQTSRKTETRENMSKIVERLRSELSLSWNNAD